ncbi:cytochrome c oxidase assembly protein [Rhodococcus sp. NPDC127528]|uniref:cytochrome c oxidase assembly protein n=1 Tax=unclassified Rhodococcus (in: high G+C Gram-positive bacteria) TaxID=192944 RepID=UPI00363BCD7B
MSFVDVPLTLSTAATSWRWDVPTLAVVTALTAGYWRAYATAARRGEGVGRGRLLCFLLLGCGVWLVAALSFVGVYADTLFWVRALQVVLLLFVVPFGLALGKPVTVLRASLGETGRARVDTVVGSRAARALTYPATTSLAMLATPWLLYLTGWYPAVLEHQGVDQVTRLVLVGVGFGYFYSRLQVDPVPHRYSQMISLAITVVEVLGDGVLGIVIWLGPEIAAEYYQQFARSWGPDRRTDQAIGAGILWLLGDVIGIPFLLVLMRAFSLDDRAQAEAVDAELDAGELVRTPVTADAPGLWWEQDPQMQERFRRR